MTVVAWDGETLAADRQSTYWGVPTITRKVFAVRGTDGALRLIGCAGDSGDCQAYLRWAKGGKRPERLAELNVLSIDQKRRIWLADQRLQWARLRHPFFAIGSGADLAMGAMAAGKTAREAVEIANRLSRTCGLGVDSVVFP